MEEEDVVSEAYLLDIEAKESMPQIRRRISIRMAPAFSMAAAAQNSEPGTPKTRKKKKQNEDMSS